MRILLLIRQNPFFFWPYALLLVAVGWLQVQFSQEQLMQWVNARNAPWADTFFTYLTYLGDGALFVAICLIAFFIQRRIGLLLFTVFAVSSLLSLYLKQLVFPHALRPLSLVEHSAFQYHLIEGLDIHRYNSFPSGHSISAFALFSLLAFLDTQKMRGVVWLALACLTAYSRVYLFQHFVEDVYAGSIIGVLSALFTYSLLYTWVHSPRNKPLP